MKSDIHPKVNPVVFVDVSTGAKFVATSTLTSEETLEINGVKHFVIKIDVSSDSHPFYTGKQRLMDTAGRVDKFRARMEKANKLKEEQEKKDKIDDEEGEENVVELKPDTEGLKGEEKSKDAESSVESV